MPDTRPALSIVIPARNEAAAIGDVLDECAAFAADHASAFEIVVVDDASTDDTARLVERVGARRPEVRLLRHDARRGIAETSHDGLTAARHDVICYVDGDGQFAAESFVPMIAALAHADFVVGRRLRRAEGWWRTAGSRLYNACARRAGVPLHDVNCGCRVLRRAAFEAVRDDVVSRSSFYFAELTLRVAERGYRVTDVPIAHRARRGGVPSGGGLGVAVKQFVDLARYAAVRPRLAARPRRQAKPGQSSQGPRA